METILVLSVRLNPSIPGVYLFKIAPLPNFDNCQSKWNMSSSFNVSRKTWYPYSYRTTYCLIIFEGLTLDYARIKLLMLLSYQRIDNSTIVYFRGSIFSDKKSIFPPSLFLALIVSRLEKQERKKNNEKKGRQVKQVFDMRNRQFKRKIR